MREMAQEWAEDKKAKKALGKEVARLVAERKRLEAGGKGKVK